ncbi:MAG: hypothetical protein AAF558_05790 [Verrucomicrobiota bacterium]
MGNTKISIEEDRFLINGSLTYAGCEYNGRSIEGLLFNSRMVQAVFDDENQETRQHWKYPDTGLWDPERNTNEFVEALSDYKAHGLLAVTVGLQGGGSIYRNQIYQEYLNSAFTSDGELKPAYFDRLDRVIQKCDELGMIVIVNYFYFIQARKLSFAAIKTAAEKTTEYLLSKNYENVLIDVANESAPFWNYPELEPERIHVLIDLVKNITSNGKRLYVGCSRVGGSNLPHFPQWMEVEDFNLPHGNSTTADEIRHKVRLLRDTPEYRKRPRPILFNEDSVFVENLQAAAEEFASWGFYCQGYGSNYQDRYDWTKHGRESEYEKLSGFQTLPVNWRINTENKRAFFHELKAMTTPS